MAREALLREWKEDDGVMERLKGQVEDASRSLSDTRDWFESLGMEENEGVALEQVTFEPSLPITIPQSTPSRLKMDLSYVTYPNTDPPPKPFPVDVAIPSIEFNDDEVLRTPPQRRFKRNVPLIEKGVARGFLGIFHKLDLPSIPDMADDPPHSMPNVVTISDDEIEPFVIRKRASSCGVTKPVKPLARKSIDRRHLWLKGSEAQETRVEVKEPVRGVKGALRTIKPKGEPGQWVKSMTPVLPATPPPDLPAKLVELAKPTLGPRTLEPTPVVSPGHPLELVTYFFDELSEVPSKTEVDLRNNFYTGPYHEMCPEPHCKRVYSSDDLMQDMVKHCRIAHHSKVSYIGPQKLYSYNRGLFHCLVNEGNECGERFWEADEAVAHQAEDHGLHFTLYQCRVCHKKFTHETRLNHHKLFYHRPEVIRRVYSL